MKKINSLQTLRLIGALSVFQYHLWNNYLGVVFEDPGTDIFLVLAGVVAAIAESRYIYNGKWGRYIWGRYLRLYVTFIPVFLVYLLVGRDTLTPEYVLKSFFVIPMYNRLPLVGPMWMVALFLVFYWLFSISILTRREETLYPVFGLWALGCILYTWFKLQPAFHPEWLGTVFDIRNLEMIAGYIAGKLLVPRRLSLKGGAWILGIGLVSLVAGIIKINTIDPALIVDYRPVAYGLPLVLIAIGLVTLEQFEVQNGAFKLFIHPWIVWLGGASYVIFLIHNMIIRVWDTVFTVTAWQVPFIIVVVLVAAALIYQFWEIPVLSFAHRHTWSSKQPLRTEDHSP